MASLLNQQLSLAFLLLLLFFLTSSLLPRAIHARESRFFMKTTRPEAPVPAAPPPLRSLGGSGYGLYGHGEERFSPATTDEHNNNNNNNNNYNARTGAELAGENSENKEYNGEYNYAQRFKYANNVDKFSNEELDGRSYEAKEYNNYVDPKRQYGMSDTRFLDNGRYFYDADAERNRNRYETYPTRGYPQAAARGGSYENGVYGNRNAYQYGAGAMEGYQNNQVNQESQEDYVP